MLVKLTFLLLLRTALSAYLPAPTPAATPAPVLSTPPSLQASPTLAPRCDNGNCGGSGSATTLQASVVTTTILSVTSVPCYITSYVTSDRTSYSTIYNTQTITSTQTKEGTVYIVEYAPTPIVKSSMIKTVVSVTVDVPTYWVESTGTVRRETTSQGWSTQDSGGGGSGVVLNPPAQQQNPAWTHVSAGQAVGTPVSPVPGVGAATAPAGTDGWAVAVNNGQAGGAVWGDGHGNGGAVWRSGAEGRLRSIGWAIPAALTAIVCLMGGGLW